MIVIGIGNEFRHDDAAGLVVARLLRDRHVTADEHEGDPASLIERWKGAAGVILVDAVSSHALPGTLHRFDASVSALPRELFQGSTHALGLAEAVELSRTLGTLPPRVMVFGVEGRDFTAGLGLSPEIERALPAIVNQITALRFHRTSRRPR